MSGLVVHLAEFDARRLYRGAGYPSLFAWCTDVLRLSEHAAYNRIAAARASRHFPVILDRLADGSIHLTAVTLLAPHLTEANHRALLNEAAHASKRDVQRIVARLQPEEVKTGIRRLPGRVVKSGAREMPALFDACSEARGRTEAAAESLESPTLGEPPPDGAVGREPQPADARSGRKIPPSDTSSGRETPPADTHSGREIPPSPRRSGRYRTRVEPAAPARYRVQFAASEAMHARIVEAQALLRHRIPSGDPAEILDFALQVLLREVKRNKVGIVDRPREAKESDRSAARSIASGVADEVTSGVADEAPTASTPPSPPGSGAGERRSRPAGRAARYIPRRVRRAVWSRDGGRCAFRAADGRRCAERGFLEFHHVRPHAAGGPATVDNIQIRCRGHNGYEAEMFFGRRWEEMSRSKAVGTATGSGTCCETGTGAARRFRPAVCVGRGSGGR